MNELTIMNFNGIETVDSRQVAKATGKRHDHLVRDIQKYCEYLTEPKIGVSDFFIESTYQDSTGRTLVCADFSHQISMILFNCLCNLTAVHSLNAVEVHDSQFVH